MKVLSSLTRMKKGAAVAVKVLMSDFDLKKNYFELFCLPVTYQVDLELLSQRYRALLQQVHPDRFVNASPQEQRLAVQYTGLVNDALDTLKSPIKRSAYLLKIHGIDIDF